MKKIMHRVVSGVFASVVSWRAKSHPFLNFGLLFGVPAWVLLCGPAYLAEVSRGENPFFLGYPMLILFVFYVSVAFFVVGVSAQVGARMFEKCYWVPTTQNSGRVGQQEEWFKKLRSEGYREVPLTYSNVLRWFLKGFLPGGLPLLGLLYLLWLARPGV